ncbi:MAG: PstS family phosphate ABC transporter substrate-binding protein [Chloroflexi bacterium]|nr:PstS family phosphate ABC transporter substrate-binding protein [Chloroflexota bacterium]
MQKPRLVFLLLAFAMVLISVFASVCAMGHGLPEVDPLDYTEGEIITAGSSTVFPLSERMAERWTDAGGVAPSIASIGSGAGFERFCVEGETDISNASRAIKDSERESCNAIGRDPIEFRVGTDALAVTVSAANDFVSDVTMEELAMIFSTADSWSDVRAEWPDEAIQRFIPGTDSGTFDYFVEEVFDKDEEPILSANPQLSEDDNVLVQGITGSPYAIGFFGYAYYVENQDTLNILNIEGIEANAQTTDDGSYPLARPLFIYSDAGIMAEKPQVNAFINFYLSLVNDEVIDVGYFPASEYAFSGAIDYWRIANGMLPIGDAAMDLQDVVLPEVDPLDYTEGEIITAGSSTVFPLSERMAERWTDAGGVAPSIASIGSGAGFERFCVEGETDISNASRAIKDSERESCNAIGRDPIEFRVGTDALAVTVSAANDFVSDVTMEELAMIFSTADSWSDVRAEWPDEAIQRFIPGTDSGTFDYFVEEVFDKDEEPILSANPQLSEDDNVLVQGITGSPYAIGFFGYAYYVENQDTLNILNIEGIEANAQTTDDGSYPLARPLYIYSDAGVMTEKPQVAAFINFYLSHVNDEVVDVGYFPAAPSALDAAKRAFLDATMGGL